MSSWGNVWFSDEANFHSRGSVNSHNAVHWGTERPDQVHQVLLHSPKLVVWCAVSTHGLIGPYFFKDQNGATAKLNSARYLEMLRRYFSPELYNFCTAKDLDPFLVYIMQDGARAHITRCSATWPSGITSENTHGLFAVLTWPPVTSFSGAGWRRKATGGCPLLISVVWEQPFEMICVPDRTIPAEMCFRACHSILP